MTDQGGGQLRVEFRLWNVGSQQQLQGTAYTTTAANWRRIAHIIGDVVYQQMIGEKGYFDLRVAYISDAGPATSPVRRLAVMDYDGANNQFLTDGLAMSLSPEYNPTASAARLRQLPGQSPAGLSVRPADRGGADDRLVRRNDHRPALLAGWQFAADVGGA